MANKKKGTIMQLLLQQRSIITLLEPYGVPQQPLSTTRHKCSACFKQFKKKEHLIDFIKISYHSVHDPKCVVSNKHCKSFESLREHLAGPLSKASCASIFAERGCILCLNICSSADSLKEHREMCHLTTLRPIDTVEKLYSEDEMEICNEISSIKSQPETVAIDCEMVGGGDDCSLDLCERICLVDEDELLIFHSYVLPQIPVTNYRDTATYQPLMKTNFVSHSLKYLTKTYLGYDIQVDFHDPYQDSVSVMRLYKRIRSQDHPMEGTIRVPNSPLSFSSSSNPWKSDASMTPDELLAISKSNYRCWCLDSPEAMQMMQE